MKDPRTFDDIRPYRDEEIPAAMRRIVESTSFPLLASYVFPGRDMNEVRGMLLSLRTIDEFQARVMFYMNAEVIRRTMTGFTGNYIKVRAPFDGSAINRILPVELASAEPSGEIRGRMVGQ